MRDGGRGALLLPRAIGLEMLEHARAALPAEACGLLSGRRAEGLVTGFHPARNELDSPLRYSVHPEDLVRIVLGLEDGGEELVGIFHSHVRSGAVPSASDRREARYPDTLHVLAGLPALETDPDRALRAWRLGEDSATEVPIVIG